MRFPSILGFMALFILNGFWLDLRDVRNLFRGYVGRRKKRERERGKAL